MKCFTIFKDKSKAKRGGRSAPEMRKQQNPGANRGTRSTGSISSSKSIPDLYREKQHQFRDFTTLNYEMTKIPLKMGSRAKHVTLNGPLNGKSNRVAINNKYI